MINNIYLINNYFIKIEQSSNLLKTTKPQIIICPYCNENIPILTLILSNGYLVLRIRCHCLLWKKEKIIELKEFLTLINQPSVSNQSCLAHNQPALNYCPDCITWLYQKCLFYHKNSNNYHHLLNRKLTPYCIKYKCEFDSFCFYCNVNVHQAKKNITGNLTEK